MGYLNTSSSSGRDKLAEEIVDIESVASGVVKPSLPSTTLKEWEYTPPSDEQLAVSAENSLADYKLDQENAIKANSDSTRNELVSKRNEYVSKLNSELENLYSTYRQASDNIDSDVLKRGLARSTIATNSKSDLEKSHATAVAKTQNEYGTVIAELDADIASTQSKLETALNDFNLTYATKLAQKLDELKSERAEQSEKVLKYNNEVKKDQAELDANKLKTESSLYSDALDQATKINLDSLSEEKRNEVYKAVYEKMNSFLASLSKEQAKSELANQKLYRQHLSDYYYYKLYDKYGR